MKKLKSRRQRIRTALILVSFILFPITLYYFSPALILEGAAAGVINASLITFGMLFASSLLLGRLWCGWGCPGAGLQEPVTAINDRPVPKRLHLVKWVVWVPWISAIALLAYSAGGYQAVNPLLGLESGISLQQPFAFVIYLIVTGLIFGLSAWLGRRGFCHTLCWMAPFMILGRKLSNLLRLPALRLKTTPNACTSCGICTRGCPMSLDVQSLVLAGSLEHSECILCGTCVDNCPKKSLAFTFGSPQQKPQATLETIQV
jgi:polyferredoxin